MVVFTREGKSHWGPCVKRAFRAEHKINSDQHMGTVGNLVRTNIGCNKLSLLCKMHECIHVCLHDILGDRAAYLRLLRSRQKVAVYCQT